MGKIVIYPKVGGHYLIHGVYVIFNLAACINIFLDKLLFNIIMYGYKNKLVNET